MTSLIEPYFPLKIHRTLICIHCSSSKCEIYDHSSTEYHIYCHSCEQHWIDEGNEAFKLLEQETRGFLFGHSSIISKALKAFTSINSFGKKKINYKKFIPELLEFFEDNCEMLEDYEIKKLDLTFSITDEGVDLIDYFLHDFDNDLKDLPM